MKNTKKLVAYFSCSGVTARAADMLAQTAGADLFEIKPAQPYSASDINWMDKNSRSTREMNDEGCRPPLRGESRIWRNTASFLSAFPYGGMLRRES